MSRQRKMTIGLALLSIMFFLVFFNGYRSAGPARSKFKKLPEGTEDLTTPEAPPEVNRLKEIANDKRLKEWITWWQKCDPGLNTDSMKNLGEAFIDLQPIEMLTSSQINEGPGRMLYMRSPNGRRYVNPYLGRLYYKKLEDGWQSVVDEGCGAALYETGENKASLMIRCSLLEGLHDAFWLDNDRLVVLGYEAITRQMSVECESVESCVAPTVWIIDLKKTSMNQYHGSVIKRGSCNVDGYYKVKLPKFFVE